MMTLDQMNHATHANTDQNICRECLEIVYLDLVTAPSAQNRPCSACGINPAHPFAITGTCIDAGCIASVPCRGEPWGPSCGEPSVYLAGRCAPCTLGNTRMVQAFEHDPIGTIVNA